MAGGFSTGALVTVLNSARTVGWGIPASGAVKVALTADGNTSHATTFGYESGTAMSGITAPARRVGYYLTAANALTTDGRKKKKTQDGRVLRRYKRRWKVERLFA